MNYQEAIKKINKLLGLYKFNSYKLAENGNEIISEGSLAVGEPIYIITDNGQLPLSDGEYELEDTTKIKVKDGQVQEIKYDMETKSQFTDAVLKDGSVVKSPTFDVGEAISIVDADGKEAPAPDGEHEIKLKDSEGKEVVIRVIVKDGKITERENVEESPEAPEVGEDMGMIDDMTPSLSSGNDATDEVFKKEIMAKVDALMKKMEDITAAYEDVKSKVAKFSKEPAGNPIKQPKNLISEFNEHKNDYISQLVNIRANTLKK
jgi:hypothetical protein